MNRYIYTIVRSLAALVLVVIVSVDAFACGDRYLRISDSHGNVVATVRCSEGTASAGDLKAGTYRIQVVDLSGKLQPFEGTISYEVKTPGITIKAEGNCKSPEKTNVLSVDQRANAEKQIEFVDIEDGSSVSFTLRANEHHDSSLQALQAK